MHHAPRETVAPANSLVSELLPGSYFHDAWSVRAADPSLSALGQFLRAAKATPAWVSACMSLRNRIVSLFGLKNLGSLSALDESKPESQYEPGDCVGIFTLFRNTPDEVLLGDNDKHLNVTVSVHTARSFTSSESIVTVTTIVKVHNLLGRAYMLPVTPMHRIIAPAVLRAVAAKNAA
jgi:hypothetical protein